MKEEGKDSIDRDTERKRALLFNIVLIVSPYVPSPPGEGQHDVPPHPCVQAHLPTGPSETTLAVLTVESRV